MFSVVSHKNYIVTYSLKFISQILHAERDSHDNALWNYVVSKIAYLIEGLEIKNETLEKNAEDGRKLFKSDPLFGALLAETTVGRIISVISFHYFFLDKITK